MSSKGIYSALSGAIAQNNRLDTIANNIANVNTPAFKRDKQIFQEYLTAYEKESPVINVPRIPASIESFYELQGADRGYVDGAGSFTDFAQGGLKPTGNTLDIAVEGRGFFEILTPNGVRYTRNGAFTTDTQGRLITKGGFFVLSEGAANQDPASRMITLSSPNVTLTEQGEIYSGTNRIAKIGLLEFGNSDVLQKIGQSVYSLRDNQEAEAAVSVDSKLHQGYLETANVNIIGEMTEMIEASRNFESLQKAIKAFDQIDEKLANEVPNLR